MIFQFIIPLFFVAYIDAMPPDVISIQPTKCGSLNSSGAMKSFALSHILDANWHRAERFCVANGMNLATIENQEDKSRLLDLMKENDVSSLWIGASDLGEEVSNALTDFAVRDAEKPSDDCALLLETGDRSDEDCATPHHFACENICETIPVPSITTSTSIPTPTSSMTTEPTITASTTTTTPTSTRKPLRKTFIVYKDEVTFKEAKIRCANNSMQLASIRNQQENEEVLALSKQTDLINIWIGASDEKVEGSFIWVDGTPLTYTNWYGAEPERGGEHCGGYDYVKMGNVGTGRWLTSCNDLYHTGYACEMYT